MGEALKKSGTLVTLQRAMKDLPPLPTVVTKVLQLTGDASSRATELEKYISNEQAISTKVLRVVNSPYFGLQGQVSSIGHAVVILGFDQIRNLVLSMSTAKAFEAKSPVAKQIHQYLWKHAVATASAAQIIARRRKVDHKELDFVFSAGLLSNIGALFLVSQYSKVYFSMFEKFFKSNETIANLEDKYFQINHAEVGQELSVLWKLPENLTILIGRHEGPFAEEPIDTLYSVHAGDRVASVVCRERAGESVLENIDPAVREWLRMSEEELQTICQETIIKIEEASDLLGIFN